MQVLALTACVQQHEQTNLHHCLTDSRGMCVQLDSLKQALRQLADDKDASLAAALASLQEKLAKQQQELNATTAALKAAQAVGPHKWQPAPVPGQSYVEPSVNMQYGGRVRVRQ